MRVFIPHFFFLISLTSNTDSYFDISIYIIERIKLLTVQRCVRSKKFRASNRCIWNCVERHDIYHSCTFYPLGIEYHTDKLKLSIRLPSRLNEITWDLCVRMLCNRIFFWIIIRPFPYHIFEGILGTKTPGEGYPPYKNSLPHRNV